MFEVGGFLAGVIGEAELGAQSIVYQLAAVSYMVIVNTDSLQLHCFSEIMV